MRRKRIERGNVTTWLPPERAVIRFLEAAQATAELRGGPPRGT